MIQYEYKRIMDDHITGTFDSLEKKCTELGKEGWRVIAISDGSTFRYATLELAKENTSGTKKSKQ